MKFNINIQPNTSCCSTSEPQQNTSCCSSPEVTSINENKQSTALNKEYPIAVIGAGPIGLAAAAHLTNAGERFIVLESGENVADNITQWQHVRLFSPWQYNVDKVAKSLLEKHGWRAPNADHLPTGQEIIQDYLLPLANVPEIKPFISYNSKVVSISKKGHDKMKTGSRDTAPFVIYVEHNDETKRIGK